MVTKLPFLPDEHHYAIANVAVRVAQLDEMVGLVIYTAFNRQRSTAKFILPNLGADRLVGLSKAILLDAFPEDRERINDVFADVKRVHQERNDIMHSIWGPSIEPGAAVHVDPRPFKDAAVQSKTADEIQKTADDAFKLSDALAEFTDALPRQRQTPSLDTLLKQALPPNSP